MNKATVLRTVQSPLLSTAVVCVLLYAGACWKLEGFASVFTFVNMLQTWSALGIVAMGVTLVIMSGGIDLSVGSGIALGTVLLAKMFAWHWGVWAALPAVVVIMGLAGMVQGLIIQGFAVPPFLITLGGLFLYRGIALLITTEQIPVPDEGFGKLSDWLWRIFPSWHLLHKPSIGAPVVILAGVLVVAGLMLTWTRFGRNIYAVGGSESSAILMGLPVARVKVSVYAISGVCAGLASIAALCSQTSGDPRSADGWELDAIAVVVIGGTALTGGVGSATGTLLGLLIYGTIQNIVQFESAPPAWTRISVGGLLLAFILLQLGLRKLGKIKS